MAKNIKNNVVNWEKISIYFAGLSLIITLWTILHQSQRDIADLREKVAKFEVKVEKLEENK